MKTMLHLACVLVLCGTAMAQVGSWTLYYSDTRAANADGSVTLTPTLGITGDDGGYCNVFDNGQNGWETPTLMLNGNTWALGDTMDSGGPYAGGWYLDFSYTFPDVTVPSDGTEVNLSYAAKIQGMCPLSGYPVGGPPYTSADFYNYAFTDGTAPQVPPAPCWIREGFSPQCSSPWPRLWKNFPVRVVAGDLVSMKVPKTAKITNTYYGPPPLGEPLNCIYNILACSTGTPTCKGATPGLGFFFSCPSYVHGRFLCVNGTECWFSVATGAIGPGPCD